MPKPILPPLPSLGDPNKTVTLVLTEPEAAVIAYMIGFVQGAHMAVRSFPVDELNAMGYEMLRQADQYGPYIESLDQKAQAFLGSVQDATKKLAIEITTTNSSTNDRPVWRLFVLRGGLGYDTTHSDMNDLLSLLSWHARKEMEQDA